MNILPLSRLNLALPLLCMAAVAACGDANQPDQAVSLRAAVTGSAEAALGANGRLQVTPPLPRAQSVPTLDSIAAGLLADAFLRQFWDALGTGLREQFERGHGSPVDLERLQQCGTRFAESPIAPSLAQLDYVTRHAFGERWLFRYCLPGHMTAGYVAVSTYATDLVLADSAVVFPAIGGGEFQAGGLSSAWGETVRFTPESAIQLAYRCTGQRVKEVPRLVLQYGAVAPLAKWLLVLESLASVTSPHGIVSVDTVYVGYSIFGTGDSSRSHVGVTIASPDQPSTLELHTITNLPPANGPFPPGWDAEFRAFTALRDASIPVAYDSITCRTD